MRLLARLVALLLACSGAAIIALGVASSPAHAKDMNCDDFNTQAAAQQYFNNNGGGPNNNVVKVRVPSTKKYKLTTKKVGCIR